MNVHENDFRDDLEPTRAQLAGLAREFCRLSGEPYPASRRAAVELLLRLERSDSPQASAERAITRAGYGGGGALPVAGVVHGGNRGLSTPADGPARRRAGAA